MKSRLLLGLALLATQINAQTSGIAATASASNGARVILQSGTYNLSSTQLTPNANAAERTSHHQLRVVSFARPLTPAEWSAWEARGAQNIGYLPVNSYLVALPTQGIAAWAYASQLPLVAASPLLPEMKLSNQLAEGNIPDYAWVGSQVELHVVAAPASATAGTVAALNRIGRVLEIMPEGIRVVVAQKDIPAVAALANVQFVQPKEAPGEPENVTGTKNHRSNAIRVPYAGGRNYRGTGVVVGHGDDGDIQPHIDFTGRVIANFSGPSQGNHGDHVAGTIMGAGNINPDAEGQAPGASLVYYDYPGNLNSVDNHYGTYGVRVTASSYSNGCNAGYTAFARQVDEDITQNYHLMHVFSAGNSGTTNCNYGAGSNWGNITGGHKQGKNVIAVANLQANDAIASSSSRGPATDGRIKPDVAALGTNVFSCSSPNGYATLTGTSMACPGTAGVLAQLYDAYRQTHSGQDPHGGLMKAILMNTSDDLGQPGPDFIYGYGRMNALRAAKTIEQNQWLRDTLSQGGADTLRITVPSGVHVLKVMLHWTDPAATLNAGRALVNNLNGVLRQGTSSWLPWVLNPTPSAAALNAPAVRAIDSLNTAEQFEVLNPTAGDFELVVNGSVAVGGSQEYFVTWTFIEQDVELTYPVGGEVLVPGQSTPIRWDAVPNGTPYQLSFSQDNGATWSVIANPGATTNQANWTVPTGVNDQMWLRITRGTQGDTTNAVMSRVGVPTGLTHQWTCPDSFKVSWSPVAGAAGYVVYKLGSAYMDSVGTTTNTSFVFTGSNPSAVEWVSVAALTPAGRAGKRAVAINKPAGIVGCVVSQDAALTAVVNPKGRIPNCQPTSTLPLEVRVVNSGIQSFSSIPIAYRVGNGAVQRDTANISLASTQSANVLVPAALNLSSPGTYTVRVWTELPGDQNRYNDTLAESVTVYAAGTPVTLPYSQDFSGFTACATTSNCGGTVCNLTAGWINATNGTEDVHDWRTRAGSTPSAGTGPTGGANGGGALDNYLFIRATSCFNSEAILYSPCIDLTTAVLPQMSFAAHMLGAAQGELHVDVLSQGRWILDVIPPVVGNQGSSWLNLSASLVPFVGQNIVVRFRGITGSGIASDIAIDAITITEVTTAPVAAAQLPQASPCLNQVVQLFDASTNSPSTWRWIITPRTGVVFANGTDSTSKNPFVAFQNMGTYSVQVVASNVFGSSTSAAATISLTAGAPLPFAEAFGPGIPADWQVENPDGGITWVSANAIGTSGVTTSAMTVNFFAYSATPQEDRLVTPGIDLSGTSLPYLVFDVAYAPYDASYIDGLRVEYSTNCGSSWTPTGYFKTGTALATKAAQTTTFTPSLAGHWRRDSIALPASISGPSVKFRFVAVNGYGNNLWLDNVQVYDLGAAAPVAAISSSAAGTDVCVLDTVYFSAVNPGSALAQWTFGPGAVPSVATGPGPHAVYFFSPGSKEATLQLNGSGGVDRDTVQFQVLAATAASWSYQTDSAFIFRGQANVSQGIVNGLLWNFGDGTTSTDASVRHVYAAAGTYNVSLTVDGGCNDVVLNANVTISSVGMTEPNAQWTLAPNPTEGYLSVQGDQAPDRYRITDLAGRLLAEGQWPNSNQIDLRALAAGTYIVELQHSTRSERHAVVKR